MKVVFNINNHFTADQPVAIALGTFDGIHKGHQRLIKSLKKIKKEHGCLTMVYTFVEHPMATLQTGCIPKSIMTLKQKIKMFNKLNVDIVVFNNFNDDFSYIQADDFINEVLLKNYNVKYIVVGYNFRFGYKGIGDINMLKELSFKKGFELVVIPPVKIDSEIVSSSLIRSLIKNGDVKRAKYYLGQPYCITGKIINGFKRGRILGYPTANLKFGSNKIIPKFGVYLTVGFIDDAVLWGLTNVGQNPTFDQNGVHIETHFLGFSDDIYEKTLTIYFIDRIRDEKKFETHEKLIEQIGKDIESAKSYIYNFIRMC